MNNEVIEVAVYRVANKIQKLGVIREREWKDLNDDELLKELIICLLSSNTNFEIAVGFANGIPLRMLSQMTFDEIEKVVLDKLTSKIEVNGKSVGYRFFNVKAKEVSLLIDTIYNKKYSIKEMLTSTDTVESARQELIANFKGIGSKQSSMYLRNINYSHELAIIDTHIADYLIAIGKISVERKQFSRKDYLRIEEIYLNYARTIKAPLKYLDLAIWIVMRTYKQSHLN